MRRVNWRVASARAGVLLAFAGAVVLGVGPLGWRLGWWHWTVSLRTLTPLAGWLGLSGAALCMLGLVLAFSRRPRAFSRRAFSRLLGGAALAIGGLAAGGTTAYSVWELKRLSTVCPRINDISTDLTNPPRFVAVLPQRAAEQAVTADYPGEEVASLQRAAYPDVAPVKTPLAPGEAYKLALEVARATPGWRIVGASEAEGRIEASQSSFWYGFVDDMVIRISSVAGGSRLDARSHSRQGRGDIGVNAARLRAYLAAFKARLDAAPSSTPVASAGSAQE